MTSPVILFSASASASPVNGSAAGTSSLSGEAAEQEGGGFGNAFIHAMQSKSGAVNGVTPPSDDPAAPAQMRVAEAEAASTDDTGELTDTLSVALQTFMGEAEAGPSLDPLAKIEGRLTLPVAETDSELELTSVLSGASADPFALVETAVLPEIPALQNAPLLSVPQPAVPSAHNLSVVEPEPLDDMTVAALADGGIMTDLLNLPHAGAEEAMNPTLIEEGAREPEAFLVYGTGSFHDPLTADVMAIATEELPISSKRLDLTQWLSRTASAIDAETLSENVEIEPTLIIGKAAGDNADALLKNALFARAMPGTANGFAMEAGTPGTLTAAPAPSVSSPAIPGTTDVLTAGRTTIPLNITFGNVQWSEAIAERTAWLASQQIQSADLHLDPPELGPLQIKVAVHHDQAVVSFVSANPQVREALDQTMARLRELFQEQGLQLVDAGVSDQQRGQDQSGEFGNDSGAARGAGGLADTTDMDGAPIVADNASVAWGVDDFV